MDVWSAILLEALVSLLSIGYVSGPMHTGTMFSLTVNQSYLSSPRPFSVEKLNGGKLALSTMSHPIETCDIM